MDCQCENNPQNTCVSADYFVSLDKNTGGYYGRFTTHFRGVIRHAHRTEGHLGFLLGQRLSERPVNV
jgi:hypothetical protein